ncbi:MAG: hypothetical protein R2682_09415 [Pyrinomonadaceae bacterium]
MNRFLFIVVVVVALLGCSCIDYRSQNDIAVERLRQSFLQEDIDRIYNESSNITRTQLSRDEFGARVSSAIRVLKGIDPELNWRRDESDSPDKAVYRDDEWSAVILEMNGRKALIWFDWNAGFHLCGMTISGDVPDGGATVFRNCD